MTREDAIKIFKGFKFLPREMKAVDMAIKALEQEPDIDKIRADVINIADGRRSISVRSIIKILDKYKAESEE